MLAAPWFLNLGDRYQMTKPQISRKFEWFWHQDPQQGKDAGGPRVGADRELPFAPGVPIVMRRTRRIGGAHIQLLRAISSSTMSQNSHNQQFGLLHLEQQVTDRLHHLDLTQGFCRRMIAPAMARQVRARLAVADFTLHALDQVADRKSRHHHLPFSWPRNSSIRASISRRSSGSQESR